MERKRHYLNDDTLRTKYAKSLSKRLTKSGVSKSLVTRITDVVYYKNNIINDAELYIFCRKFDYLSPAYSYRNWGKRCNEVVLQFLNTSKEGES